MRQIDFSDGYETAAAPDQGVITTGGFGSYSSDANFVTALTTAGGTLTEGHAYFNSVLDRIRFYSGAAWLTCLSTVDGSLFGGVYANDAAYISAINALGETLRAGSFYFNSTDKALHYYDGAAWRIGVANDLQATLTNKDIDLGAASASKRITLSKGTFATINALTRKEGTIYYATDNQAVYFDDGSNLIAAFSAPVSSVNGYAGVVILVTDDIAEGSTNLYWTFDRMARFTNFKYSVRAASVSDVALTSTVSLVIDGLTIGIGDRILLAGQSNPVENGMYTYNDDGVNYTLTRSLDADGPGEVVNGTHVYVSSGTLNGGFLFYLTTLDPITVGVTSLSWSKLGAVFIDDAIVNGVTSKAPSQNAVFDALALKEDVANKGIAGGYAELDGGGTVPLSQLPSTVVGAVDYKGTWDASPTNTPDLPASTPEKGDYYVVSVAGSTSLGGITDWQVGDWAIFNGTVWEKVDNSEAVTSVNAKTGTVVLVTDDIAEDGAPVNLWFTDARAKAAVVDDSITDGITDKAPSQNAVFDALAGKQAVDDYITDLTGDVLASGPGSVAGTIAVGAVTDTKGSLSNKPAATVVATTNQALTGTPTIDGQSTVAGSIILLSAQSAPAENGPWVAAAGAWSRPTWYPAGGTTQAFRFITMLIRLGTTYQGTVWRMTTAGAITIDTDAQAWSVTPIALNASSTSGALPETRGGTGQATYAAGDSLYASGANTLAKRTIGALGQFNRVNDSGLPDWQDFVEPAYETRLFDDWIGDAFGVLRWLDADTLTGVSATSLTVQDNKHPGILELATGTTNGAIAARTLLGIITGTGTSGLQLGNGPLAFEWLVNIPTLATVTDDYRIDLGLALNQGLTVAQVKMQYSRAGSANWRGVTTSASVSTTLDTGIAVATGWTKLKAVVNGAATSVEFFVNGVSGGTIATNIPLSTENLAPHCRIIKASASAVSHLCYLDYFKLIQRLTVTR